MKILIAEDNAISCRMLELFFAKQGYEVVVAFNGNEAWNILKKRNTPQLVILDWMMPGMSGIDVCKKVCQKKNGMLVYIIFLTARGCKKDITEGLQAGANDYITKPFDSNELQARVQVGIRMIDLQNALSQNIKKLEEALNRVKQLQGLLPICAYCKRIRVDKNYWQQVERYISEHADVQFSHSICPECYHTIIETEIREKGKVYDQSIDHPKKVTIE